MREGQLAEVPRRWVGVLGPMQEEGLVLPEAAEVVVERRRLPPVCPSAGRRLRRTYCGFSVSAGVHRLTVR